MAQEETTSMNMPRALYNAARCNDLNKLESLHELLSKSNKHWREFPVWKTGDSLLHVAVRAGHLSIVRYLCEEWTDGDLNLEVSNSLGKKVLHDAAQMGHEFITEYLLDKGAEVNSLKGGDWTPLMMATTRKGPTALATIKALFSHGADPMLKNKDGWTALHIACREGDIRIVDELVNHGVESITAVSYNGRTPLHVAALHGYVDVARRLLQENSCPKDCADSCGFTPLMEGVRGGHINIVRLLLEFSADLFKSDKMGRNCSHLAAETGHTHILQFLIPDLIPNVDTPSADGVTPLHCAARCGQTMSVRLLIDLGADPLLKDSKGRTARDFCYSHNGTHIPDVLYSTIKRRAALAAKETA